MKYILYSSIIAVSAILVLNNLDQHEMPVTDSVENGIIKKESKSPKPNNQWVNVRSYPTPFDQEQYIQRITELKNEVQLPHTKAIELGLPWIEEGPGNIGGRFNCLAMSPTDQNIIYAGAANGGIFKTTNGGTTWDPIFDDNAYLAIGDIELDPNDENTVFVGTGDKNFGGGSHLGNGLYRSTDAGSTWDQIGLEQTAIITEVIIDPANSDRIFVSTLGNTYEKTTERGVYRTTDGGVSWQNILFISDSSGVIDMIMDPSNSDVLYATGYNRINLPFDAKVTGPDANIYKTIDGGDNWVELTTDLPGGEHSRIGLSISNVDPNILYALYVDGVSLDVMEVYKSTNAGTNWAPLNVFSGGLPVDAQGGFGWYFGEIYINPYNNNQLIIPGVNMYMSMDGGSTWTQNVPDWWDYTVHADKHAIQFLNATSYIIATDGGLYKTVNNGVSWTDIENIPATQLYHIDIDELNPGLYGAGAQDNGTMSGNASVFNFWERLYGGDGFRLTWLVDDVGGGYYETQNGGLLYMNSISFTVQDVSPTITSPDRVNWDMPYVINESTSELFIGSSEIMMMDGAPYGTYQSISGDLTQVGQGSFVGDESRHDITEIELSPFDDDKLYVGTGDGLIWRGDRVGVSWSWTNVTGALPDRYVTAVRASPNFDETIYAGFSGYKYNEEVSYLYKSDDDGATWTDISGNLPGITVNDILIVPGFDDDFLFAALDGAVYFSADGGLFWDYVGAGLPFATISELALDEVNEKLIAGTYSRSMWSYDVSWMEVIVDESGIDEIEEEVLFYPNPVHDLVYFENLNEEYLDLYNLNGQLVLHKKINKNMQYSQVNISSLPAGTYYFKNGLKKGKVVKD